MRGTRFWGGVSAAVLFAAIVCETAAGPASLLKDIRQIPAAGNPSSTPQQLAFLNGRLYFSAIDATHGREPWTTDGFSTGILADLNPGLGGSSPTAFAAVASAVIFRRSGTLYRTDGTAAGTAELPASVGSDFFVSGGVAYFAGSDAASGTEPWRTDGTPAGTYRLKDISPGTSSSNPRDFCRADGLIYFVAADPVGGAELWKTDGAEPGTERAADLAPGPTSSDPFELAALGDSVYFVLGNGSEREIWKFGGTDSETTQLTDPATGTDPLFPDELTSAAGRVFFRASTPAEGRELWSVDGSTDAVGMVEDVYIAGSSELEQLTESGGKLFFVARDDVSTGLFVSDGTAPGTMRIPGADGGFNELTDVGGILYCSSNTIALRSDGTGPGTFSIGPLGFAKDFAGTASLAFFTAADPVAGTELWRTDGTAPGTELFADIALPEASSSPNGMAPLGSLLVFAADDGVGGEELWHSDATESGTQILSEIVPGNGGASPKILPSDAGGVLYFEAADALGDRELWITDGSDAGTERVKDIHTGGSANIEEMTLAGGDLYFSAFVSFIDQEPWRSDGTTTGTFLLKDIAAGPGEKSKPRGFTELNGLVYFSAADANNDRELWVTDGTTTGTVRFADINPGSPNGNVDFLVNAGSFLLFAAQNGTDGVELWRTDGTGPGTAMVKDIRAGPGSSFPSHLRTANGLAFFFVTLPGGSELWASNGTEEGTVSLRGGISPFVAGIWPVGSGVVFISFDEATGFEPWFSNGAPTGTHMLEDFIPGPTSSSAGFRSGFFALPSGKVLFGAPGGFAAGEELWITDLTEDGSQLVQDLAPGPVSSSPSDFAVVGNALFFAANHPDFGRELWTIDIRRLDSLSIQSPELWGRSE